MKQTQIIKLPDGSEVEIEFEVPTVPVWKRRCTWWEFVLGIILLFGVMAWFSSCERERDREDLRMVMRMVSPGGHQVPAKR